MFYLQFVCLFVSLFVCLLATSRKTYSSDLHENFTTDVTLDKEVPTKFLKSSGYEVRIWTPDLDSPWRRFAFSECSWINQFSVYCRNVICFGFKPETLKGIFLLHTSVRILLNVPWKDKVGNETKGKQQDQTCWKLRYTVKNTWLHINIGSVMCNACNKTREQQDRHYTR